MALFIMMYTCFHMGSLFTGMLCTTIVVLSLPISAVILRQFLGINYMCALHIFVLILALGIGADNMFVFYDTW